MIASLDKIVEETGEISRQFEFNLEKRKEMLQQITSKLDERIQEGNKLCVRLEQLSRIETERPAARQPVHTESKSYASEQQKVLALAQKGLNATEIAKRLKRPIGEVELILNLRKIAS